MDEDRKTIPMYVDDNGQDRLSKKTVMEEIREPSSSEELKQAIRYLFQSIKGKCSLESYLEMLGDYTDKEIRDQLQCGSIYRGGEVTFVTSPEHEEIQATFVLEFQDAAGGWRKKEAKRMLQKSMFTSESVRRLEIAGELSFGIQAPDEESNT